MSPRPLILIVDDARDSRRLLAHYLENEGNYRVIEAENGLQALELFTPELDLVLMDMHMPVMDGYEAVSAMRSMPGGGSVPVVAITGQSSADARRGCIAVGCTAYLVKPVRRNELVTVLHTLLPGPTMPELEKTIRVPTSTGQSHTGTLDTTHGGTLSGEDVDLSQEIRLDPDIAGLFGGFIEDRVRDAERLDEALAQGDFDAVWRVGHSMMGTGSAYGVDAVSQLGRVIRDASREKDAGRVATATRNLRLLVERLEGLSFDER